MPSCFSPKIRNRDFVPPRPKTQDGADATRWMKTAANLLLPVARRRRSLDGKRHSQRGIEHGSAAWSDEQRLRWGRGKMGSAQITWRAARRPASGPPAAISY